MSGMNRLVTTTEKTNKKNGKKTKTYEVSPSAKGAIAGVAVGAYLGGPMGAVIGGTLGAIFGPED